MKKLLLTLSVFAGIMTANAQGVYQIPNSDFENWANDKEPGNGWNSFNSAGGTLSGAKGLSPQPQKVEGYNSTFGVKLGSKNVFGKKANGNLTTGRINMGSMNPSDKSNHNHTDLTSNDHSLIFAGTPDAVSCMAKFKSGGSPNGRGQFIIHDKYDYKDPETSNDAGYEAHKIALAAILIPVTDEWKYFEEKFEYTGNTAPAGEQYMLASFTTNPTPGGSEKDELIIDDVKLIYYSELASLNYDSKEYFQKGTTAYSIDAVYDDSKLTCTSNGKGATIEPSYNEDEALLTITVKGNDISVNPENVHTYTVQFAKPQPEITEYENDLLVAVNGQGAPIQKAKIQLIKELDGTTSLALNNFVLGNGDEALAVGNIKLTNLEIKDNKIQATQTINITEGDDPAYEGQWFGPILGEVPVSLNATLINDQTIEAIIDIPLTPGSMEVKVTFAETQTYTDGEAISLTTGLTNVVYNRTFPAGWSTICLPFATSTAAFGADVKAQAFASADDNGLNFAEVTELDANKPYLIYFPSETTAPIYLSAEVETTTPVSVTFGDFTFCGSYAASMSMSGKYGVADQGDVQKLMLGGEHSTLGATRAYFTKSGDQPVQIRLNLDGNTTAIDEVEQAGTTFTVYTLQGVLVREQATTLNGLPKGIYIVNGKKVVVK